MWRILLLPMSLLLIRHDVTFPFCRGGCNLQSRLPGITDPLSARSSADHKTSVHGVINMLGLAKRTNACIFQASTGEVYGDPEVHPQPETYWGNSMQSAYEAATTKASAAPRRFFSTAGDSMG
jgi:GDP-mannose 4,6 dehydratase